MGLRGRKAGDNFKRDLKICFQFRQGFNMSDIGVREGISRERVRQILKEYGVKPHEGGIRLTAKNKKLRAEKTRLANKRKRIKNKFGVTLDQYLTIKDEIGEKGLSRFRMQQSHVNAGSVGENIKWKLNLAQFVQAFKDAGLTANTTGYVLCRKDFNRNFTVKNIVVLTRSALSQRIGKMNKGK